MTPLPHSSRFNAELAALVAVVVKENKRSVTAYANSDQLKQLYRSCSAIDAILDAIDDAKMRPSLQAARSVVLQLPVLLLFSFPENALVELRRFVEIVFWNIYFHEHPVEWRRFVDDPATGYSRDLEQPIAYCSHRELGFYVNYARDRFSEEPSKLATNAVSEFQVLIRELNAKVHAASLATTTKRQLKFSVCGKSEATYLCSQAQKIFSVAAIVLCATHRKKFDHFGPVVRAYFDKLVGSTTAKRIRSHSFGLRE